jgi:hypothetical protein
MVSSIRSGARPLSLISDKKTFEDGLLAGVFDGIPSPKRRLRRYNRIQYSNRLDPQENHGGRMIIQE